MAEVFICDAIRTPIGRWAGALSKVRPDDLLAGVFKTLMQRNPNLDPAAIDEVFAGCANQAGEDNRSVARMSLLLAGLPTSVPGVTINRLCASGLDAVGLASRSVKTGEAELVIAGGVESMTRAPLVMLKAESPYQRHAQIEDTSVGWRFVNPIMKKMYGVDSMPETGENVAQDWKVSREDQDAFALRSQQKTAAAQAAGFFDEEIVPVTVPQGKKDPIVFAKDEHPRADTTLEGLAKLKPIVRDDGTVTAGNASGVNDGAAAMILATEAAAKKYGLTPRARVLGYVSAGVEPRVMGIGPIPATNKLMAKLGLKITDFDVIELNEAFASQSLVVLRELGLADDAETVNRNGGAIAIGHPLGATGARLALTAAHALQKTGGRYGLATLCVGVGQGVSLAMERV